MSLFAFFVLFFGGEQKKLKKRFLLEKIVIGICSKDTILENLPKLFQKF